MPIFIHRPRCFKSQLVFKLLCLPEWAPESGRAVQAGTDVPEFQYLNSSVRRLAGAHTSESFHSLLMNGNVQRLMRNIIPSDSLLHPARLLDVY